MRSNNRLLIISNNVLSETRNNGKTILSYIDGLVDVECAQLYFSEDMPSIKGYKYFKLSDRDILKDKIRLTGCGQAINQCDLREKNINIQNFPIKRNDFSMLCRELLWKLPWKSNKLKQWLIEFNPTAIFFVAGDCVFAYRITNYIKDLFGCKLTVYITDDYIMPNSEETYIHQFRRKIIIKALKKTLKRSDNFYTISNLMQSVYKQFLGVNSKIAVNMTESMKDEAIPTEQEYIYLIYTGSLYYGRDDVLHKIAQAVEQYNKKYSNGKKAILKIFTNIQPGEKELETIQIPETSYYEGSLDKNQLKIELNRASILVFVESFDIKQIEKTKYSLSTKIPEYLSIGKAIFAVGPADIASMLYLKDKACTVNNADAIYDSLEDLILSQQNREELGKIAEDTYKICHNKNKLQQDFYNTIL